MKKNKEWWNENEWKIVEWKIKKNKGMKKNEAL